MVLEEKTVRRRAIFAFYDKEGIVDDYIPHLLRAMGPFCERILAVVNGTLSPEGRGALEGAGAEVLLRENEGLDISGYRAGILHWEAELTEVDELVLFNQTVYGPIWPLQEMFCEMDRRDLDFWGLTMHPGMKIDPWGTAGGGAVPHHLQSYFMAVRARMLKSEDFVQYWRDLPPIASYYEAVGGHEVRFTDRFEKLGYRAQAYIDASDLWIYSDYPLMIFPYTLATKYRCPVVKRKTFFAKREEFLVQDPGAEPYRLFQWLKEEHSELAEAILKNLLRTESLYQIEMILAPLRQVSKTAPEVPILAFVRDNPLVGPLAKLLRGRVVTAIFENEHARIEYLRAGERPQQEKEAPVVDLFCTLTEPTAVIINMGASTDGTVFDRAAMEEGVQAALWLSLIHI